MELERFIDRVPTLTDLELATLLCLVAKEHCLFETEDELLEDLASELVLIVSEVFRLSYAVLSLDDLGSVDSFGNAIIDKPTDDSGYGAASDEEGAMPPSLHSRISAVNFNGGSDRKASDIKLDTRKVVNVVIAKDFNLAPEAVQIQALELIRRRRIFSRTTVHAVAGTFLFLPLIALSTKHVRINKHVIDRIFISHYHNPDDGFSNLEEMDATVTTDQDSVSSFIRGPTPRDQVRSDRMIPRKIIDELRKAADATTMTVEVRRYMQDLIVFMRLERGVRGGVSPFATKNFVSLAKLLAPLHGINFVTPALIALAARKIYPHRLLISTPDKERSMQYGSELEAVAQMLEGVTPETVVEAVLNTVECPL